MKQLQTLEEMRAKIDKEVPYIDVKPYSHNIVGVVLSMIAKEYGDEEANSAIEDFRLDELGWSKKETK